MEMRIILYSVAARIPATNVGIDLESLALIDFRHTPSAPTYFRLGVGKSWGSLRKKPSSLLGAWIDTTWVNIDATKNPILSSLHKLIGKTGEIEIKGFVIGQSKVDITFSLITDEHEKVTIFSKYDILTKSGAQFQYDDTTIRGQISVYPLD